MKSNTQKTVWFIAICIIFVMREFCFFCYLLSYYENIIKSQNVLWKNIYIWFWHFLYKMRAKIRKKSNFGKPHGLSQKTNINNFLTFWSYEEQERNVKKKLILDFEVWTCRHCTHSYTHNKYYLVLNTSIFFHFGPTVDRFQISKYYENRGYTFSQIICRM